ncbi:hypothetical protein PENTCL1PPCAC_8554 [Pristionchus entomophagus]|uniref:Protein kinase domain-containing protein n=1 Tax=Pristionchus entomophagus TaxID=358040 RepID=A0AAV5T1H1_9BILA|nr:hypothetical protein PENTCL1PPCAC_8554 [Pristionchus entomophagus]
MYMAPEQKRGSIYSNKADVFALGLTMTELFVAMTKQEAEMIFDKYRMGKTSDILAHLPEVEQFVAWLSNTTDTERPACEEILEHSFIAGEKSFQSEFLNKFEVLNILGKGEFNIIFEVANLMDRCSYAVKRISVDARDAGKPHNEVIAHKTLRNEGIVSYITSWIEAPPNEWQTDPIFTENCSFIYIQMELCTCSLADWIRANEIRDSTQITLWFKQLVSTVAYIHKDNRIHRDLKPSNILINKNGRLKICDLFTVCEGTAMEKRGVIGTRLYMAPEQLSFGVYDSSVDIFSLGLILIELSVVMTVEERFEIFNDVRCGMPLDILQDQPLTLNLVMKLAQLDRDLRPCLDDVLSNSFFSDVI